jgi:hypothetical protein
VSDDATSWAASSMSTSVLLEPDRGFMSPTGLKPSKCNPRSRLGEVAGDGVHSAASASLALPCLALMSHQFANRIG